MKKHLLLLLCLGYSFFSFSQLNIDSVGHFSYDISTNDIWGYVAPDSTEYALVGTVEGVSIVSLATPETPIEVAFIKGRNSSWRDLKTWGQYAYITTDRPNTAPQGLQVIDLSGLPDTVSHYFWSPTLDNNPADSLKSCHNLYIDENGYCYLAGCNLNNGGVMIVDIITNPDTPQIVGLGPTVYSHDVYVRDDVVYSSEIDDGVLSIYDASDKFNFALLGRTETPFQFTHNAWLSDDGNTVFTTEELANAPTTAYDISDLQDIKFLNSFVPVATKGQGVIPHNVHYINGYLAISHYGNGLVIVDANRPENLVEVGNFDTDPLRIGGFSGAWGAYPFLPSGLVLVSDIGNGLFVLRPTYTRAAYLEGIITDSSTGEGIVGVTVAIEGTGITTISEPTGDVKTGHGEAGTYTVTISKRGYISQTVSVELINGEITPLNIALEKKRTFTINGTVVDEDGNPISDALVVFFDGDFEEQFSSNETGVFIVDDALANTTYMVAYGKWGYITDTISVPARVLEGETTITEEITFVLEEGIKDPFLLDLGWMTIEENIDFGGGFALGVPVASPILPVLTEDVPDDLGASCYSTDKPMSPPTIFNTGKTVLTSPPFDVSGMTTPTISYATFYLSVLFARDSLLVGTDTMFVMLDNGEETVVIDHIINAINVADLGTLEPPSWEYSTINIKNFITPTDSMTIRFELSSDDFATDIEAGVDDFSVFDAGTVSVNDFIAEELVLTVTPNPFKQELLIRYDEKEWEETPSVVLFDVLGKRVLQRTLSTNQVLSIPSQLPTGIYFLQLQSLNKGSKVIKLMKE